MLWGVGHIVSFVLTYFIISKIALAPGFLLRYSTNQNISCRFMTYNTKEMDLIIAKFQKVQ